MREEYKKMKKKDENSQKNKEGLFRHERSAFSFITLQIAGEIAQTIFSTAVMKPFIYSSLMLFPNDIHFQNLQFQPIVQINHSKNKRGN